MAHFRFSACYFLRVDPEYPSNYSRTIRRWKISILYAGWSTITEIISRGETEDCYLTSGSRVLYTLFFISAPLKANLPRIFLNNLPRLEKKISYIKTVASQFMLSL